MALDKNIDLELANDDVAPPGAVRRFAEVLRVAGKNINQFSLGLANFFGSILVGAGGILQAGDSVAHGQVSKGAKELIAGATETGVELAKTGGPVNLLWWLDIPSVWLSGGKYLSTHARNIVGELMDTADHRRAKDMEKKLAKVQMQTSQMTGIAMAPALEARLTALEEKAAANDDLPPGRNTDYWRNQVAANRGMTLEELDAQAARNGELRQHVADLEAARDRSAREQGIAG